MLLHGINYNILIPHLSYSGLYQDEAEKLDIYKEINIFFGLESNPKNEKMVVQISL